MRIRNLKTIGIIAISALLVLQLVWLFTLYRASLSEYHVRAEQCLVQATDLELNMRRISIKHYDNWYNDFKDTSTYIIKTVRTADTTFSVRVKKNDPTTIPKIWQFGFIKPLPLNIHHVDSIFKSAMREHRLEFKSCYVDYLNLKRDTVINSSASKANRRENIYTETIPLDILNTIGVKAYINASFLMILQPAAWWVCLITILTLIELFCLGWLIRKIILQRRETLQFIRDVSTKVEKPVAKAAEILKEVAHAVKNETWDEDDVYLCDRVYELLQEAKGFTQILRLIVNNEDGGVYFSKVPFEIYDFLESLESEYKDIPGKKVTFRILADRHLILMTDQMFFDKILHNIIENSIKFSDESVNIDIKVEPGQSSLIIIIRDDGWGIPQEEIKLVCNITYQVQDHVKRLEQKGRNPGNGLGLSFVQSFMKSLNGNVWISSEEGRYTEVKLIFVQNLTDRSEILSYLGIKKHLT